MNIKCIAPLHIKVSAWMFQQVLVGDEPGIFYIKNYMRLISVYWFEFNGFVQVLHYQPFDNMEVFPMSFF